MAKRKRKNAPGAGRPPSGIGGEKSSTYPKTRIQPEILADLQAFADARGVPVWVVISEAGRKFLASSRKPKVATR